eukprot:scaffold93029_cov29-Tisochrysis_lutea.AAC.2
MPIPSDKPALVASTPTTAACLDFLALASAAVTRESDSGSRRAIVSMCTDFGDSVSKSAMRAYDAQRPPVSPIRKCGECRDRRCCPCEGVGTARVACRRRAEHLPSARGIDVRTLAVDCRHEVTQLTEPVVLGSTGDRDDGARAHLDAESLLPVPSNRH